MDRKEIIKRRDEILEKSYGTLEKAELKLDELNETLSMVVFCPLIKSFCRNDCVCFDEAVIRKTYAHPYKILSGGCSNSMFFGD